MHLLLHILGVTLAWLGGLASALSPLVGAPGAGVGGIIPAAVLVASLLTALGCALLVLVMRVRLIGYRREARARAARVDSALLLRDAVISAGRESVAVLSAHTATPLSFAGGNARLHACLRGSQGANVGAALSGLLENGIPFALTADAPDGRNYALRGCPIGGHAAVFLREETPAPAPARQSEEVLESLPYPVWIRGSDLSLKWANHAFLAATDAASLERAMQRNAVLGEADLALGQVAQAGSEIVDARRYTTIAGQQRALAYSMRPLKNGEIAGVAMDVTDINPSDRELTERAKLEIASMNLLSTAVAIFSRDHRLVHYNRAYAQIWQLSETWLDTHPTEDEILERLREARRLPERRDFHSWKREHLKLFEMTEGYAQETWHLASGTSLRVEARCHVGGGIVFLYDDITERLRLESAYNSAVKVQKATLDALSEAVAVFGPDGRLKSHNAAFAQQWRLTDSELAGEPHLNRIADLSALRIGRDEFWEVVRAGVASSEPERSNHWGLVTRADGRPLCLSLARLPDGSTLLTVREVPAEDAVTPAEARHAAAA